MQCPFSHTKRIQFTQQENNRAYEGAMNHSQTKPVVVYIREADISPDVHAIEYLRVGAIRTVSAHLHSKERVAIVTSK